MSEMTWSTGGHDLRRSRGKQLQKKHEEEKATVWFCFKRKHKQDRKHLIYLIMLLIFIMEMQGTLENPSQTKITQIPASSFTFAFSALIQGLEVDCGGGPSSALY